MKRIAIDVPIGYGPREADALARAARRRQLGLLDPRARALRRTVRRGRRNLRAGPRARRADPPRHRSRRTTDRRFREVHPEVCFTAMNDMQRLKFRKKSAGGAFERLGLLRRHGINIDPGTLGAAATIPLDDLLDAAACAWTASRRDAVLAARPARVAGRAIRSQSGTSAVTAFRRLSGHRVGPDHARGEPLKQRAASADGDVMSAAYGTPRARPLDREGLAARIAPFAGALLLAFAFLNLRHDGGSPDRIIDRSGRRRHARARGRRRHRGACCRGGRRRCRPSPSSCSSPCSIDVDGGSGSSFAPLVLVPVLWLALYGTRAQLLAGILGAVAVFLVPDRLARRAPLPAGGVADPDDVDDHGRARRHRRARARARHAVARRARRVGVQLGRADVAAEPGRVGRAAAAGAHPGPSRGMAGLRGAVRARRPRRGARQPVATQRPTTLLRETAFSWASQLRGTDLLARYGDGSVRRGLPRLLARLRARSSPSGCARSPRTTSASPSASPAGTARRSRTPSSRARPALSSDCARGRRQSLRPGAHHLAGLPCRSGDRRQRIPIMLAPEQRELRTDVFKGVGCSRDTRCSPAQERAASVLQRMPASC